MSPWRPRSRKARKRSPAVVPRSARRALLTTVKPAAAASLSIRVFAIREAAASGDAGSRDGARIASTPRPDAPPDSMAASRGLGEVQTEAVNLGKRADRLLGLRLGKLGERRPQLRPQ